MEVGPRSDGLAVAPPTTPRSRSAGAWLRAQVIAHRRLLLVLTLAGMAAALVYVATLTEDARDAHAYYVNDLGDLYSRSAGSADAYIYPPLLAELVQPLRALPWPAFETAVRVGNVVALGLAGGPFAAPLLLTLPIQNDIAFGNINLWLGLLVVGGLRWPALWSGVLLTKITPGVGLLWFVGRRDWRGLLVALGATAAVAIGAIVLAPGAWADWVGFLRAPSSDPSGLLGGTFLPVRLVIAAPLALWAGYRNRSWALVVASWFAVPLLWPGTFAMLTPLLWRLWLLSSGGRPRRLGLSPA